MTHDSLASHIAGTVFRENPGFSLQSEKTQTTKKKWLAVFAALPCRARQRSDAPNPRTDGALA